MIIKAGLVISRVLKKLENEVSVILSNRFFQLSKLVLFPLGKLVETILEIICHGNCWLSDLNKESTIVLKLLNERKKESHKKGRTYYVMWLLLFSTRMLTRELRKGLQYNTELKQLTTKSTSECFSLLKVTVNIENVPANHVFLDFSLFDKVLLNFVTEGF